MHCVIPTFDNRGQKGLNRLSLGDFLFVNLSIVVPAYNEAHHLDAVIRRLANEVRVSEPSFEIVLVNNGSTDATGDVARQLSASMPEVRVVDVPVNQGYGHGILQGLASAEGDVLGWAHADEQAKPEHLLQIYRDMRTERAEIGKAVRIERRESPWRIIQSRIYNAIFRAMFGVSHRDINGTPKLMTRSLYERVRLSSAKWFIDPELMLKAADLNVRVQEVEILWDSRKGGKSKVHLGTMFHFLKHMFRHRYRTDITEYA
jgi:dolichol-phosphate mannosyltransferase